MLIFQRCGGKRQIALGTHLHPQRWFCAKRNQRERVSQRAITSIRISTATSAMSERIIHLVTTPLIHLRSWTIPDVT